MPERTVYFSQVKVTDTRNGVDLAIDQIRDLVKGSLKKATDGSIVLSARPNQVTMDIVSDDSNYLFCTVGKVKDVNTMRFRDYETNKTEDVLSPEDAVLKGPEVYTYFLYDYTTSIIAFVAGQSAPSEQQFAYLLDDESHAMKTELVAIPNPESYVALFENGSALSQIEITLPVPNAEVLEKIGIGLSGRQFAEIGTGNLTSMTLILSSGRRKFMSIDPHVIKGTLTSLLKKKDEAYRLSVRGKSRQSKIQEYDLKSQIYKYKIDVPHYRVEQDLHVPISRDEMAQLYFINIRAAYMGNYKILVNLINVAVPQ